MLKINDLIGKVITSVDYESSNVIKFVFEGGEEFEIWADLSYVCNNAYLPMLCDTNLMPFTELD